MICPNCGSKISNNTKLCPYCNKVTDGTATKGVPTTPNSGKKKSHAALWAVLVLVIFIAGIGAFSSGKDTKSSKSTPKSTTQTSQKAPAREPVKTESDPPAEDDGTIKSGSYTLPSGYEIYFNDSVRNDATGRWRLSTTSDSFVPAEHAVEYYEAMFSSDDEVHAVWNATLGTMTRIIAPGGSIIFADTFEYVNGEEHDAKELFSGLPLTSKMYDAKTREEITDSGMGNDQGNTSEPAPISNTVSSALGDYYVEIKNAFLAKDYDGNPAIIITYSWTNNSKETTSAEVALMEKAFQGGVQLSSAVIGDPSIYDSELSFKDIRPGITLDVQCAYELSDETSVVEFELSELFSFSDDIVAKNFDPSQLN